MKSCVFGHSSSFWRLGNSADRTGVTFEVEEARLRLEHLAVHLHCSAE
jgi:hypothetical protein